MSSLHTSDMDQKVVKDTLRVDDLHVNYGAVKALKGVSFRVGEGELVALLGSNGAGKTTTLKTVMGVLNPIEGSIQYRGERVNGRKTDVLVKKGITLVPEGRRLFQKSSVLENLEIGAIVRTDGAGIRKTMEQVFTLFPVLQERRKQLAESLSGGEQQMLAIGRALMSQPKMLLLDEPSMGLAPKIVDQIFDLIVDLNRTGTTILMVEQNASLSLEIVDRAYVLEGGRTMLSGTATELINNNDVAEAYLGASLEQH